MIGCSFAAAEESGTATEGAGLTATEESEKASDMVMVNLRMFDMMYKVSPDNLEEMHFIQAYVLFVMYCDMKSLEITEDIMGMNGLGQAAEWTKYFLRDYEGLKKVSVETFNKWIYDKITFDECKKTVMEYIGILVENEDPDEFRKYID